MVDSLDSPLHLLEPTDPKLDEKSSEVAPDELLQESIQNLVQRMFIFARGEQSDRKGMVLVGLAAPQVGVLKRIILVDLKADGKGRVGELIALINPKIMDHSNDTEEWYEGCYSTGNLAGIVRRSTWIDVSALTVDGKPWNARLEHYPARIVQHEIDHLDGIRFPQRDLKDGVVHLIDPDDMSGYRNREEWRNWKHTLPQSDWKSILTS